MLNLRYSVRAALVLLVLTPVVSACAEAGDASGSLDAKMQSELAHLKAEQNHLENQMKMAQEISSLRYHMQQMRAKLIQSLQATNTPGAQAQPLPVSNSGPEPQVTMSQPVAYSSQPSPASQPTANTDTQTQTSLPPVTESNATVPLPSPNADSSTNTRAAIERQIAILKSKLSSWAGGGVEVRSRTGTSGVSSLSNTTVNAAASTTLGNLGRLTVSASDVHLSSGGQPSAKAAELTGSAPAFGYVPTVTDKATGVGFDLKFSRPGLSMNVGSTPTGFLEHGLIGGVNWQPWDGPIGVDFSRKPVTDSLLSYAGMYDAYTGSNWGGVFANNLQLTYGSGVDPSKYFSVSYAMLKGTNVESNSRFIVDGGLRWPVATGSKNEQLQIGLNMLFMSYAKNLSFFTLGQGGYFSPQTFYRPSVTVDWSGHIGDKATWAVSGRVGWQMFSQSASPYFPTNPGLQAQANALNNQNAYYAAQNVSSLAYSVTGQLNYLIAPQWLGTGWFKVDNSRNYQNLEAGLSLQYFFSPLVTPPASDRAVKSWMAQ